MSMPQHNASERTINQIVGEKVHTFLWRGKIPQSRIAAVIGITQSALSRKLRGEQGFAIDQLLDVADALGVEVIELLPRKIFADDGPGGPEGPGQGHQSRLPESNRRPFHYSVGAHHEPADTSDTPDMRSPSRCRVIRLHPVMKTGCDVYECQRNVNHADVTRLDYPA